MAFTFDAALSTDLSKVRFHIGDTVDAGHRVEDATITALLASGGIGPTVVACIQYIVTQLSQPEERLGSYSISNASALEGYKSLLKTKAQEFNVALAGTQVGSSTSNPWRGDSYMTDGAQDGTP